MAFVPPESEYPRRLARRLALVLAFGAGATDAITFSRLGDVFASVMTGNLVLLGLSLGSGETTVVGRVALALAAFVVGVLGAGVITRGAPGDAVWPRHVTRVLIVELVVMAVFTAAWLAAGARPDGTDQTLLLAGASFAMGLQSGAVIAVGIPGLSTTYLTGTLTTFLTTLAHRGQVHLPGLGILAAALVGAFTAALAIRYADHVAPALPLGAIAIAVVVALRTSALGADRG